MRMSNNDFKKSNDKKAKDVDQFWNIDFMLPPKKTVSAFTRDTETVEINIVQGSANNNSGTIIPKKGTVNPGTIKNNTSEPIFKYKPDNPLIRSVAVWHWPSKYSFYERFRSDAIKYFSISGSNCAFTPFFSYMPQYLQLNREQRSYYLWWRENVRNRVWLKTEYSYIYLYIYEIINLPDFVSPAKGLESLCDIWLAYRAQFPKLDRYLIEWICDYCLVNMMDPPYSKLAPIMGAILDGASFKEFYLRTEDKSVKPYAVALLNFAANYNWRTSKFYNAETSDLFEKHIYGAFLSAVEKLSVTDRRFIADEKNLIPARLTRDAYSGSLCAYNIKRRIDVEYSSCVRSPELRMLVTDLIKCAENQVRILLGVKNRFSTSSLTEEMKNCIIQYFEPFVIKKKKKAEEVPEYMKLYEAVSYDLSPESALDIEKQSWNVTNRLISAFDEDENETAEDDIAENEKINNPTEDSIASGSNEKDDINAIMIKNKLIPQAVIKGLAVVAVSSDAFIEWAKNNNMLPDTAAEMINEALYDIIGDIVIECSEGVYVLIGDYIAEIEDILKTI